MSHEMIVTAGTECARLFLARMDLPVFCHLPLTYAQLCTQESQQHAYEALNQLFLFRPSANRQGAEANDFGVHVACGRLKRVKSEAGRFCPWWGGGATQSSKAWKVVQKLRHPVPVVHSLERACRVIAVAELLDDIVDGEAAHVKEWLYSDGRPDGNLVDGIRDSECAQRKVQERVSGSLCP